MMSSQSSQSVSAPPLLPVGGGSAPPLDGTTTPPWTGPPGPPGPAGPQGPPGVDSGGESLASLSDVAVASPANGQVLTYVTADGKWENTTPTASASGDLVRISQTVVSTPVGGVTITVPATAYSALRLYWQGRTNGASTLANVTLTFNGDNISGNYYWQQLQALGGSPGSSQGNAANNIQIGVLPGASAASWSQGFGVIDIPNHLSTTMAKTLITQNMAQIAAGANQQFVLLNSGIWNNVAAITSIGINNTNGGFVTGTTFTLYGLK